MKLQIHTSESADEVEKYLRAKHSLEAYYSTDEQEIVGDWGGAGAELLGLKGVVTNEAFARVIHNLHPETGEQLTDRMRKDRRPGDDWVWNLEKPYSVIYAYTKDERIIQGLREVVAEMMEIAQEHAAVRVRAGNKNRDEDRLTGKIVTAEHIHLTARPEDGYSDPHLHVHLYVPNISYDPEEKKWKALQAGFMRELADSLEKLATKRMAEKMQAIGMQIVQTEHGYEIEGFDRAFIEQFSRRTLTIEKTAERLGITDPAEKAKLAALTRENKIKDVKFSDFEEIWWASLKPEQEAVLKSAAMRLEQSRAKGLSLPECVEYKIEPAALRSHLGSRDVSWTDEIFKSGSIRSRKSMNAVTRPGRDEPMVVEPNDHDREAVRLAAAHLFERNSVVMEHQIAAEATRNWLLDKTTVSGLMQAARELPLMRHVKDGRVYVTTPEIWAEEQRIKDSCFAGRGQFEPMMKRWEIQDTELNAGQRNGVQHILTSRDFITGLKGDPGVGKTRVLKEIERGAKAGFNQMLMLAPGSSTVHNVLKADGFENAETVAMLLRNPRLQQQNMGGLWVVDEAGQLSNPDTDALIALAKELGARLVLVGDVAQHNPVGRGRAFELLEQDGLMSTAHITEIQRQKGEYKRTVELILEGEPGKALDLMAMTGNAVELPFEERRAALAKDFVDALESGESTVVISPTHKERRAMTEGIRAEMKKRGLLKDAYSKRITREVPLSNLEKSEPSSYKPGMIVEMESEVKGFRLHERVEVVAVRDDLVRVRSLNPYETKTRPLPLHAPESFSVYESEIVVGHHHEVFTNLAWTDTQKSDAEHYEIGQRIQINAHVKGFALGEQLEVVGVSEDTVELRNARGQTKELPLEFPKAFSVYQIETIELCEGEHIRTTGNGRCAEGRRLNNGTDYVVDYITHEGEIVLTNGRRLDPSFKHFETGYTETSHGIQGRTLDRVFIAQSVEMSAEASDIQQFLVSISRGRNGYKLYSDDLETLRDYISRERKPMMASELFREDSQAQAPEQNRGSSVWLGMTPDPGPEPQVEKVVALSEQLGAKPAMEATPEWEAMMQREMEQRRVRALSLSL